MSMLSRMTVLAFCMQACALTADENELRVKTSSDIPVVFDGHVSKFEYYDAAVVNFQNSHGQVTAYIKSDAEFLYFAFEIPDTPVHMDNNPLRMGDDIVVMLDVDNVRPAKPGANDIRAYIRRKPENSRMQKGDLKTWQDYWGKWEYRSHSYVAGWEVECRVPLRGMTNEIFTKPVEAKAEADETKMGISFRLWGNIPPKKWAWPSPADEERPDTWGTLILKK